MPDLHIDGPHSPDNTRAAAALLPEVARFLNHATGNHAVSALEFPSDVSAIVGYLESMAAHLPQLCDQILKWLQDQNRAGKIRADATGERLYGGDTIAGVTEAGMALLEASRAAGRLHDALARAYQYTDTMAATDA